MTNIGYHKAFVLYELIYTYGIDVLPDDVSKILLNQEYVASKFGNPWPFVLENLSDDFNEED